MASLELNSTTNVCRRCGKAYGRLKGNFPASYAPLYKGVGFLPYCKPCVDEMFNLYMIASNDPKKAVRQMCRKLDIYWSEAAFEYIEKRNNQRTIMTAYLARVNSAQYVGKCYDDTLTEEGSLWELKTDPEAQNIFINGRTNDQQDSASDIEVDPEIVDFWGEDYSPKFLLRLDKRYKRWTDGQEDLEPGSISLFKHICILEETIAADSAAGRPVDKNTNTLNTLLGSLNLKPVQKKSEADAVMENTPFGVWIDRWEHKRPVPEPDPALKDVDGIIRYITIWFYGHISKTLGIPNVYCEMYEKEMEKMKVSRPEAFDEEVDDDEAVFNAIFGNTGV